MSIASVRAEVARYYRSALDHVAISEHGGAFSLEDIQRYAKKAPAVVIGCLGLPSFEMQATVVSATAVYGAFCVARETKKSARDVGALLLAESVAVELIGNNWDSSASSSPRKISGANLYSVELDKLGIAMWAIRWEQLVDLERNASTTLDDFETMYSTYYIGDDDDANDLTDVTDLT